MSRPGPATTSHIDQVAASLLKMARLQTSLTQRELAAAAGVPHSTVARIESATMQPTLPTLYHILAAAGLQPRIRLAAYDDHDDTLDALAARFPLTTAQMENARDHALTALTRKPEPHDT